MQTELEKLARVRAVGVGFAWQPVRGLLGDAAGCVARSRGGGLYPSDLRAMPRPVRLTLLAVLCWSRAAEITDALVGLRVGHDDLGLSGLG